MEIRASTPTSSFSFDDTGQTRLQIILSKCLKAVEAASVPEVFEKPHLPIEKPLRIIFFVTVSAYEVRSNLWHTVVIAKVSVILFWPPFGSAPHSFSGETDISDLTRVYRPCRKPRFDLLHLGYAAKWPDI